MAFTSESGRWALCRRGVLGYIKNHQGRGYPNLVRARAVLAAQRERQRVEAEQLASSSCCEHCSLRRLSAMQSK
jgi:hypothetical protein